MEYQRRVVLDARDWTMMFHQLRVAMLGNSRDARLFDSLLAGRPYRFFLRQFEVTPAKTMLAVRRLTSQIPPAGSVSSRSLMWKITLRTGVAKPPKFNK